MKKPPWVTLRWLTAVVLVSSLIGCDLVKADTPPAPPIYDFFSIVPERPSDAPQPTVLPKVVPRPTPKPSVAPRASGGSTHSVRGVATYYCCTHGYPSGAYAAAGGEIRIGRWRGRYVQVCAKVCVKVRLVDWCACKGTRIIDLYPEVFRKLAPLSRGIVTVTVRW